MCIFISNNINKYYANRCFLEQKETNCCPRKHKENEQELCSPHPRCSNDDNDKSDIDVRA